MIHEIKTPNEFNEAKANKAVAIYFHSPECSVCNVLLPKLDNMLMEYFPKLPLCVIKANEMLELCASLQVFAYPSVLIYFEGKETLRLSRNINLASLSKMLERPYDLMFC